MRWGRVTSLLLFAVLAVAASASARVVAAQAQPPITLDVRVGYEGVYRLGEWFPVRVSIGNDGPDLRGVLEWSFTGQADEQVFRQAIDLPRGSRKRVTLEVFARDFARTGTLRLLDGENPLVARDVSLDAAVYATGIVKAKGLTMTTPSIAKRLPASERVQLWIGIPSAADSSNRDLKSFAAVTSPTGTDLLIGEGKDRVSLTQVLREAYGIRFEVR